jgi:hypothetical protein
MLGSMFAILGSITFEFIIKNKILLKKEKKLDSMITFAEKFDSVNKLQGQDSLVSKLNDR